MEENKIKIEEKINVKKMNFFKRFWYSITNFDKYMEMSVQGTLKAVVYLIELTIFMCAIMFVAKGINFAYVYGIPQNININSIIQLLIEQQMINKYINALFIMFDYFIIIVTYVIILSIIGDITARLLGIRMRYHAIYNISSYSVTLSTVLYTAYLITNIFITFKVKYMSAAFMAIGYIYIITVILIIKADIIKKHQELMKIISEEQLVKEEMKRKNEAKKENEDKNNDENKEDKKENKKDNKENPDEDGLLEKDSSEPEGNEV